MELVMIRVRQAVHLLGMNKVQPVAGQAQISIVIVRRGQGPDDLLFPTDAKKGRRFAHPLCSAHLTRSTSGASTHSPTILTN